MRRIIWGVGLFFLALIVAVCGFFFALRADFGSSRILKFAQSFLKNHMHTEFTYSSGQFDFMKGFHFRNLKIIRNDETIQASIEIPEIDLSYNIAILHKRIEIYQFAMKNAKISVVAHTSAKDAKTPNTEVKSSESIRSKLERFILNPPVEVVIDQVSIENTEMHAELIGPKTGLGSSPEEHKLVDLHAFNFHFKMEMVQERLAASGDIAMSPRNRLEMLAPIPAFEKVSQLEALFTVGGQWSVDIHREGKGWLYRLETNGFKFAVDEFYKGDLPKPKLAALAAPNSAKKRAQVLKVPAASSPSEFMSFDHAEFLFESNSLLHSTELFQLDRSSIETMKITMNGKTTEVTQKNAGGVTTLGPQTISFGTLLATDLDFDFSIDSQKIQKPPTISRAVALKLKAHGSVPRSLDHLKINSQVELASQRLLNSDFELTRNEEEIGFKGTGALTMSAAQAKSIAAANKFASGLALNFETDGKRSVQGDIEASFKMKIPQLVMEPLPKSSKLVVDANVKWKAAQKAVDFAGTVDFVNPIQGGWFITPHLQASLKDSISVKGVADVSQTQRPAPTGPPLILGKPLHAEYDVDLSRNGHAIVSIQLPAAEIPGKASLDDTEFKMTIVSPDLKAAQDLTIDFDLKQVGIQLAKPSPAKLPSKSPAFSDVVARGKIQITDKRRFFLEGFKASLNGGEFSVDAQASGDIQEKTLQSTANISLQMHEDFPEVSGQKLRGQIKIPVTVNVLRARQISLVGEMSLEGVSWRKGDLSASGINGKIPFSEKLIWDGKNVRFASLVSQNPFERVDFDRVRPLLQGSERLRIDQMGWFEKSYGPMVGFFSLDQNMIFAHQFDMDLVNGKLYGEMFINVFPQSLQFGLLARMTGLDLGEILPKKFLTRVPNGSKSLSGRAGFVLNFNRNTMDGRIDVTEIGGSQLITAINIVDPVYADEKMNKVRRLLEVGYPTSVELSFADGYMDMDLGLTVLGVSSRQNIHGVRISSMLQKATSGFMETAEKGPLK